ncbi:putative collagen alpha-1(II) chain [Toxoplasma gondii MAS]|uniref:Putative collagen alpha-1(II) chain n=1 Tax=Toxoplasma gondii MAS TaxID=943118 RepID=A0A086QN05_TOXGO|nr:putative collagen alpha-1(II) chain [Toxoplasma gondii MAS]
MNPHLPGGASPSPGVADALETNRSPSSGIPRHSHFSPSLSASRYHPYARTHAGDSHAAPGYSVPGAYLGNSSFSASSSFSSPPAEGRGEASGAVSYVSSVHFPPPASESVASPPAASVAYVPARGPTHGPPQTAGFSTSYSSAACAGSGASASPGYFPQQTPGHAQVTSGSPPTANFQTEERDQQRSHLLHGAAGSLLPQQRPQGNVLSPDSSRLSAHYHVRPALATPAHARPPTPQDVHAPGAPPQAAGYAGGPSSASFPLASPAEARYPHSRPAYHREPPSTPSVNANGAFAGNGTSSATYGPRASRAPGEVANSPSPQPFYASSVSRTPSPQGPSGAGPTPGSGGPSPEVAGQPVPPSSTPGRTASPVHAPAYYRPSGPPSFASQPNPGASPAFTVSEGATHGVRSRGSSGASGPAAGADSGAVHASFSPALQLRSSSPLQDVSGHRPGDFGQQPRAASSPAAKPHAAPQPPFAPQFAPQNPSGPQGPPAPQKPVGQDVRGEKPGGAGRGFEGSPDELPRPGSVRTPGVDSAGASALGFVSAPGGGAVCQAFSRAPSVGHQDGGSVSPLKAVSVPLSSAGSASRVSQAPPPCVADTARRLAPASRESATPRTGQSGAFSEALSSGPAPQAPRPLAAVEGGGASGVPCHARDPPTFSAAPGAASRTGGAGLARPVPLSKGPVSSVGREGASDAGGASGRVGQGRQLLKTLNFSKTLFVTESFTDKKLNVASNTLRKNYENFVLLRNKNAIVIPGPKKTKDHPRGTIVAYNSGYIVAAATREQFVGMNLSPAPADLGVSGKKGGVASPPLASSPNKEAPAPAAAPSVQTSAPIYADWIRKKFRSHEAEPLCRNNGFTRPLTVMTRADIDPPFEVFLEELRDFLFLHFPHWLVAYDPEVAPCLVLCRANPNIASPTPSKFAVKKSAGSKHAQGEDEGGASASALAAEKKKEQPPNEGISMSRADGASSLRGGPPGGFVGPAPGAFACRRKRPFSLTGGGESPFSAELESVSAAWGVDATQLFFPHLPSHMHLWPPAEKIEAWRRRDEEARTENRSFLQCKFVIGVRHVIAHGLKSQQELHAAMTEFWPILRFFTAPSHCRFRSVGPSRASEVDGADPKKAQIPRAFRPLGEEEAWPRLEEDLSTGGESLLKNDLLGEPRKRRGGPTLKPPATPPSQPAVSLLPPGLSAGRNELGKTRAEPVSGNSPGAQNGARKRTDMSRPTAAGLSDDSASLQPRVRVESKAENVDWNSVHLGEQTSL